MTEDKEGLLLPEEERHRIANSVPVEEYPTSTQYWDAIIEAELQAQLSKVQTYYETKIKAERERIIKEIETNFFWIDGEHGDLETKDLPRDAFNKWQNLETKEGTEG